MSAAVERFAEVYVEPLVRWVSDIDFALWPQQHPVEGRMRPAMVNDTEWQGFGRQTYELLLDLMHGFPRGHRPYNRMLSVVMPGDSIHPHRDEQPSDWVTRVHVPLTTNPGAVFVARGESFSMEVGWAYTVDTRVLHEVLNYGESPRIHFMFDVAR